MQHTNSHQNVSVKVFQQFKFMTIINKPTRVFWGKKEQEIKSIKINKH